MVDIVTRAGKGSPLTNNEVDANFTNLAEVSGITGEPMGHEDRTTSTISFNASTRTFTIAPVSTSFTVWCKGKKVVVSSAQTVTIPNTTGMYSIYYDANGVLAAKAGYFTFSVEAPTAYVYWNAATGTCPYFGDERHGVVLDWQTHEYLHRTRGAALASGFGASGYTLGGNGSSNAHAQLTLEGGTFFDEDMKIIVTATNTPTAGTWEQDLLSPARIPVLYLSGTGWVIDAPTDYPLKQGTARPQYNALSGGVWSTADVANNKYATSWILATNNLTYPVIAIIGQAESDLQSAAEAVDFTSLQLPGFPSVEFRPLYRLVFQCADSFSNAVKASLVSITDIRSIAAAGVAASLITDHGNLSGLSDDDHPQYLSVDTVRSTLTAAVKASFLPSQTGNAGKFLTTDATSTSWTALTSGNITTALGFTPYNATNPAGYITGITSSDVTTALGFTPYNATNPSGYITTAGARGAISVTGAGSYDSATGVINIVGGVTSFNTRTGAITLSSADVTTALGFTPYNSTNPNGYLTGITSTQVTTALGYTPYNSSNPSGYISGITSGMVTTALGYTPYNSSNPSGYITSSALSGYLTSASAASTYAPLTGTGASGTWTINITGTASGETLATVTARGGSTSSGVVLANTGNHYSGHFYYDAYDAAGNHYPHFQSGSNGTGATINWRVYNAAGSYLTHYWDKNSTEFANNVRAPSFYDSNDTAYYVDPNGDSRLSGLSVGRGPGGSTAGNLYIKGNHSWRWIAGYAPDYGVGNGFGLYSDTNSAYYLSLSTAGNWWFGVNDHSSSYRVSINGVGYASSDFRAPIFYDSNDTGFYVDPNSTSRLNGISVYTGALGFVNAARGSNFGYSSSYGTIIYGVTSGSVTPCINVDPVGNASGAFNGNGGEVMFRNGVTFITPTSANTSYHASILQLSEGNVYFGSVAQAASSLRAPIFYDSANTAFYLDPAGNSYLNASYFDFAPSTVNLRITTGPGTFNIGDDDIVNLGTTASARSPLFYDYNDTSYYADLNGQNFMRYLRIAGDWGGSVDTAQLGIRGTYPSVTFRSSTTNSVWLRHMDGAGDIQHYYASGGLDSGSWSVRHSMTTGGTFSSIGDHRAPIFYDSNDTGTYINPNGSSIINAGSGYPMEFRSSQRYIARFWNQSASGAGWWLANDSSTLVFHADSSGDKASLNTDGVFIATGSSRAPIFYDSNDTGYYTDPNSTSVLNNINVAGTIQSTNGNGALRLYGNLHMDAYNGNDIYLNYYSSRAVRMYYGSYSLSFLANTDGIVYAYNQFRTPLIYDNNDTAYYVDPNNTSQFNQGRFRVPAYGGGSGVYSDDRMTLSVGNSGLGSIVYQSQYNSSSYPDYGMVFIHGASGGNRNVWSISPDGPARGDSLSFLYDLNSTNIHVGTTRFRLDGAGNSFSQSSSRAPIFYDSSNTAYYTDPTSTSRMDRLYVGNGAYAEIVLSDDESPNGIKYVHANGNNIGFLSGSGSWIFRVDNGGTGIAESSLRAPIFYDYNDTGYYANPNGGSQFNTVSLAGIGANTAIGKVHSGSDFPNGTLVQTNIWAADWAGASFVMEVTGKSYSSSPPFSFMVQGYLYADTIINCSAINHGTPISYVKVFNYNNYLCFWWPRWGYWNSFEVRVRDAGGDSANRVTSITDSVLPSGSKMVEPGLFNTALYGYNQGGNLYASAYYDNNDTGYYTDPHSTSRLNYVVPTRIKLVNNVNNEPRWDFSAYVVEAQHWYGNNSSQTMYLGEANWVNIRNTADIHGDARSPIYYDRNDTTYYADLNSTGTSIRAAGNITAYYSDMRLKTHLGKIENARDKVRQLEGFYYEANELAQSFGYKAKREVGVSAQAVQAVLPEIVTDAPINSNYLTIDYERLTPLLIEAIKEQDTELVDLRNRVAQLESLITKLIGD